MLDLSALDHDGPAADASTKANGAPLILTIDSIDEDPAQPRTEFEEDALQELAETIKTRGVRQPISVRTHPTEPDRWMLNFGARRLRASKLAGRQVIPAFVDETADSYDQVIENEQRESLKPLELALFIQRQIKAGDSQAEIARRLGKSRSYITFASALIDAPDWLMNLYREGKCRGVTELYELRRLQAAHGDQVERWCAEQDSIARADINVLKTRLAPANGGTGQPQAGPDPDGTPADAQSRGSERTTRTNDEQGATAERPTPVQRGKATGPVLLAEHHRQVVEVLLDTIPDEEGDVYVCPCGGGERRLVTACELKVLRVVAARPAGV